MLADPPLPSGCAINQQGLTEDGVDWWQIATPVPRLELWVATDRFSAYLLPVVEDLEVLYALGYFSKSAPLECWRFDRVSKRPPIYELAGRRYVSAENDRREADVYDIPWPVHTLFDCLEYDIKGWPPTEA